MNTFNHILMVFFRPVFLYNKILLTNHIKSYVKRTAIAAPASMAPIAFCFFSFLFLLFLLTFYFSYSLYAILIHEHANILSVINFPDHDFEKRWHNFECKFNYCCCCCFLMNSAEYVLY